MNDLEPPLSRPVIGSDDSQSNKDIYETHIDSCCQNNATSVHENNINRNEEIDDNCDDASTACLAVNDKINDSNLSPPTYRHNSRTSFSESIHYIPNTHSFSHSSGDALPRKFLKPKPHSVSYESPYSSNRRHEPCTIPCCCGRTCLWPRLLTWSSCCEQGEHDYDDEFIYEEEPFRKRCFRACFTFIYICLATVAVVATYSMVQDLITSMNNPVRSIHYKKVTEYEAPGIAVYPGGAKFLACGHYYNNVVTSKVSLTQLDLVNHTCNFTQLKYTDPHYPDIEREVTIMRGPTSFVKREAIFLHFELEDESRDFFTVSYFVFPEYDKFTQLNITEQGSKIVEYHRYVPTFALSAGLRMWIKLIMSESHLHSGAKHVDFRVEYSVVRFHDRRPDDHKKRHLFFIFFEWKNDIIEQSYLIYTTTPWSIGAGLCGVFLTLHRGYQLSQTSYKRVQKDKERRSIRKRTIREIRQQRSRQTSDEI